MRKLLLSLAALSVATVASAQITLIPNGDFELGGDQWTESNGGSAAAFSYPATGGNTGGYGQIEEPGGGWAVLVSPVTAGAAGGGVPIGDIGVVAGASNTFSIDLKTFAGTAGGGMKVEAWAGNALLGNSGDVNAPGAFADWTTFTFDWDVPAGTEKMIFVPLWGAGSCSVDWLHSVWSCTVVVANSLTLNSNLGI
jgi:hypothetical protein